MNASLAELVHSNPVAGIALAVLFFLGYLLLFVVPLCGLLYLFYFLLTLPLRRNERARFFLDLLELGLKEGRTPEATIADAATSRDRALGVRFHLLAAHIEQGQRLSQALERVPRLLPPQVVAMLRTGERIGDIGKVLPACRHLLRDAVSQVRGALNYVILLAFVVTPFTMFVPLVLRVKVLPAYRAVFAGMTAGSPLPAFTRLVFGGENLITWLQMAIIAFVWLAMLAYLGGPRMRQWTNRLLPGLADALLYRLPWRRKRLQRDFSAMLAVLLDAGVPETEAVSLAADAAGNLAITHRAATVRARLQEGVKLPEAIRGLDDTGELQWRMANALRRGRGFLEALTGWHEALDAKAFQLEQSAAQIATTLLVLLNGVIVAAIVIAIFLALIQLINEAVLW